MSIFAEITLENLKIKEHFFQFILNDPHQMWNKKITPNF